MVKAILFGSLSTLANLVDLERRAFNMAFRTFGVGVHWKEPDYEELLSQSGRFSGPTEAADELICQHATGFYEVLECHFRDLIDETPLEPHRWTAAALEQLAKRRVRPKVALVSGAARQTVLRVLAAVFPHRASSVFDVVTSQETAAAPKPSPTLYIEALAQLGALASDAIAIEATQHGLLAAQSAGIATAGFRSRYSGAEQLRNADFDLGEDFRSTLDRYHASKLKRSIAAE
ncbi:HAD hydrolase-like protein [Gymnodinialimonas sp. 2305UL16-5]|uniref:HAD family hydrolase n=1 Tax=Gymnodinialimonas mytili TaxID=3126503 RepID=UPI0030AF1C15